MISHSYKLLVALSWLLLVGTGCGTFGTERDEAAMGPEAVLEANVKTALISDADIHAAAIGVSISGKRVTLTGFVANETDRRRAEQIAGQVEGAEQVINRIELRGNGN